MAKRDSFKEFKNIKNYLSGILFEVLWTFFLLSLLFLVYLAAGFFKW